jgi:hypothetical protein
MDILETSTKAIDLYAEETKRRIEQLEKSVKEKEEAIKKHKAREEVMAWIGFFLIMIVAYLAIVKAWCR